MSARSWRDRGWRIFLALLVGVGSLVQAIPARAADADDKKAVQAARDAVREALQREVYGLDRDRQELLSSATIAIPDYAPARWQQGYVRSASGWTKPEQGTDARRAGLLNQYEKMRSITLDTAAGQFTLAEWCRQQGLNEEARAHWLRICDLEPNHVAARQRLDHVRVGPDWIARAELTKQQAAAAAVARANEFWQPVVAQLAENFASRISAKRKQATEQVLSIHDPAALPALQSILGSQGEAAELLVVTATAGMTDETATAALARHAVFSPSSFVREAAVKHLKSAERDRFVPMLISSLYTPVVTRIAANALPNGRIGYRHEFLREGAERQELLVLDTEYRRVASPTGNARASSRVAYRDAARTAGQLEQAVVRQNEATAALNDRICWVLNEVTGEGLPAQPDDWWKWWNEENEVFVEGSKQVATISQSRRLDIVERDNSPISGGGSGSSIVTPPQPRQDCLAAGTPVWTERGQIAIEQVRVGDLVLSRDVDSGELTFKPVVRTTIRPEGPLVKVTAGRESFETSGGHLFWVSGQGWVKSRKLESGMVLHTANGPVRVSRVEPGSTATTYNLVVADFNTYFVGEQKLLSHDNTVRRATTAVVPGLKPE
jgi:hypothetical protein